MGYGIIISIIFLLHPKSDYPQWVIDVLLYFLLVWLGISLLKIIYKIATLGQSLLIIWQALKLRFSKKEDRIFHKIDKMSGEAFEQYIATLLKKSGFTHIQITQTQGDQGIDILAMKKREKYGFQCKRWRQNVGNSAIQEAYAGQGYYKLDRAVVVTNSFYTRSATQLATELKIELWNRHDLTQWIIK